jgi:hypothetical protein
MYYAIDDADGNEITTGLPEETARETARRIASERGESVYLYEVGSESEPEPRSHATN